MLRKLINEYTDPFYLFDMRILKERLLYLKKSLPNKRLVYAVKANTFIIKEMDSYIDRYEVCSPGEGHICLELGIDMDKMVISGVYKSPDFIEYLIKEYKDKGIYTIESLTQLKLLLELEEKYEVKLKVLLRLTSANQFGLDEADLRYILKEYPNSFNYLGLQYYSGTQKKSEKRLVRELGKLDELLKSLREDYSFNPPELELGPGLPVAYFKDEEYNEVEHLEALNELLDKMSYSGEISLELGRAIAAECGSYFTRVVDMKRNKNESYAIVDGGMNHIAYYGQSLAMRIPFVTKHTKNPDGALELYNICGSLCTTNDIIVKSLELNGLMVGDILEFKRTGAYSMTEGISLFLSRDLPRIFIINENNELKEVRNALPTYKINKPNYGGK